MVFIGFNSKILSIIDIDLSLSHVVSKISLIDFFLGGGGLILCIFCVLCGVKLFKKLQ